MSKCYINVLANILSCHVLLNPRVQNYGAPGTAQLLLCMLKDHGKVHNFTFKFKNNFKSFNLTEITPNEFLIHIHNRNMHIIKN